MCKLTATIPNDAYHRARVWAAKRDTFTLRVRPQSHQNAPRKTSLSSAFPSLTTTPPVTYRPATAKIQKINFAVFYG
jgi:hypothetical protein